ncbi:MAG: polysaccharide deacetylase family protein [Clostridia bacterium]|nr:polysaccharide deacetylase family protein [Clostridia bacterium]
MEISNIIYLSEIGVCLLASIIGCIILAVKKKKGFLKLLGVSLIVLIATVIVTFALERPSIKNDDVVTVEAGSEEQVKSPNMYYHFRSSSDRVVIKGNIDYNKVGEYDIEYEVETLLGTFTKKGKVKVVDTKGPEITLIGDEDFKQSYKESFIEPGYKAEDEQDGDLTEKVVVTKEMLNETDYNLIYKVEDLSGNSAKKVRKVTIIDDVPPTITLNGNKNMIVYLNGQYTESGAKALDEKDGDLTDKIQISGEVNTSKEGTYKITYKVADSKGNEAVAERTVVVKNQDSIDQPAIATNTTPVQPQNGSNGKKGVIYLTFDDGPTSNITPKVLDILKEKNVKATFFILNYNGVGESLVKREFNEGHTVAIHGYSHDYATIYKSEEAYMQNLKKLQDKIKATTGYTATITRFPGGSSNTISRNYNQGIMTRLCKLVLEQGYKYFDWNVSSGDAGGAKNADQVYNNVISGLSKSKANVVLMHDFSSNSKVLDALPRIIDYGLANGYTFERITESTPMVTHRPNN